MKTLLLFVFSSLLAVAAPRTWTSTDGRTIEAEFLGWEGDAIVLQRADGPRFTLALDKLSPADQKFAQRQPRKPAPHEVDPSQALAELAVTLPIQSVGPQNSWDPKNPECVQVYQKYRSLFAMAKRDTIPSISKMIHTQMDRDLAQFAPIASTKSKNGASLSTLAAQCNQSWIQGALAKHLAKFDSLAQ